MLDAQKASEITEEALAADAEIIKPYIAHIERKIKFAAKCGKREINHPFSRDGRHCVPHPIPDIKKAVRMAVELNGYTWIDHPDPDPGSPTSRPYTTISW